jgi:hypothetical protein
MMPAHMVAGTAPCSRCGAIKTNGKNKQAKITPSQTDPACLCKAALFFARSDVLHVGV